MRQLILCNLALFAGGIGWAGDLPTIDFTRDIRPILSDKCFKCHGPDSSKREAGLRLDSAKGATKKLESGKYSVVPGKPESSELIRRVSLASGDEQMPPASTGKKLSPAEKKLLKEWIQQGAHQVDHWSFSAPVRPPLPAEKNDPWVKNPIDAFILAEMKKHDLTPSPAADPATLLRRMSLDLVGLPPSPKESADFHAKWKKDPEQALAEARTRLLANPHFGERWARLWLDAARYADSDGFEKDKSRQVYFYRDWVINAFNRDLPYDQFVVEQLAGDLLPGATQDQRVATGFLRNSMINEEGGVDPEQFRMEAMFDRMDAIGKAFLGLTIQCSQCHSHKFDPISQEEYYKLFAYFNNCDEANIAVYTPSQQQKREEILTKIAAIYSTIKAKDRDWKQKVLNWSAKERGRLPSWEILRPELDTSGGQKHTLYEDGSIFASGYAPTKHTTEFTAKSNVKKVAAVRLELLTDPNLPLGGPGRSIFGTFGLTEIHVLIGPADKSSPVKESKIKSATADVNPPVTVLNKIFDDKSNKRRELGPIAFAIDGKDETAWGIDVDAARTNVPRNAVFLLEKPVEFKSGVIVTIKLAQDHGGWNSDDNQNNNLGRFRLSITNEESAKADILPAEVRVAVEKADANRSPADLDLLFRYWITTQKEFAGPAAEIEKLYASHPRGDSQLVLAEAQKPRRTAILTRGDFLKPTAAVNPGVPEVLRGSDSGIGGNRLDFARWLVSRRSPTTARAFVNRIWQAYFGIGLVPTAEDLGMQSPAPSHPELLDWLAVEFMDHGYSIKYLHQLIVSSATYRQQSKLTPELMAKDPNNRYLARSPRLRMEAEVVRDIALSASGLLNPTIGGASVFPPAPGFLFQPPASYGPKIWYENTDAHRYRRGLYTFRYRSVPYPMLQNFDAPNGDAACVRRTRSNTPLQALTTLNEPIFLECARALARRVLAEGGADADSRLPYAFQLCAARNPDAKELGVLRKLLEKQITVQTSKDAQPWVVAADDPKHPPKLPAGVSPADAAAWTVVARVLLNLDETITKE